MIYREFKPDFPLSEFIDCFWMVDTQGNSLFKDEEIYLPSGRNEVIINFGKKYAVACKNGREYPGVAHIVGTKRTAYHLSEMHGVNFIAIRFKPGGLFNLIRIPISELEGRIVDINEIWKDFDLNILGKLYELNDFASRVRCLSLFLIRMLGKHNNGSHGYFKSLVSDLVNNRCSVKIDEVREKYNIHYKKLERDFGKYTGINPLSFLNIIRFNRALAGIHVQRCSLLTSIAYESGYYDQAHFIKEFKSISGYSPGEYRCRQFMTPYAISPYIKY